MSYRKSNIAQLPVLEEVGLAEPAAEAIIEPPVSELLESPELPPVTRKLRNRIGSRNNNSRKDPDPEFVPDCLWARVEEESEARGTRGRRGRGGRGGRAKGRGRGKK